MTEDIPLRVFSRDVKPLSLRKLRDSLRTADCPVSISLAIAGEAMDTELDTLDWEAAFIRWTQPELHDVYLLERVPFGTDEVIDAAVAQALYITQQRPESGGKLLTADHLHRTKMIYTFQIMPALIADDDHPAWDGLDLALRCVAENTEGIVYAEEEGFYDADGELLLAVFDDEEETDENAESSDEDDLDT